MSSCCKRSREEVETSERASERDFDRQNKCCHYNSLRARWLKEASATRIGGEMVENDRTETISLIFSGNGPNLTCNLQPVLRYERNVTATVALSKISFYAGFENISSDENNELKIKPGKDHEWTLVKLKSGAYDVDEIYHEIIDQLSAQGIEDVEKHFDLRADPKTLRVRITLANDYQLSFDAQHSIANLLGYRRQDYLKGNGRYEGIDVARINTTTGLFVLCDIARASYMNGKHVSFIHKTMINTTSGVRFVDTPANLVHVPLLVSNSISDISVWIVDQDLRPVKMLNNELEIELRLVLHHHNVHLDNTGNVTKRKKLE